MSENNFPKTPKERMKENLANYINNLNGDLNILNSLPNKCEKHGDLILLPQGSFDDWNQYASTELWTLVAHSLGGLRLALKGEVTGPERRPNHELLLGNSSWVTHREHGINYSFDICIIFVLNTHAILIEYRFDIHPRRHVSYSSAYVISYV